MLWVMALSIALTAGVSWLIFASSQKGRVAEVESRLAYGDPEQGWGSKAILAYNFPSWGEDIPQGSGGRHIFSKWGMHFFLVYPDGTTVQVVRERDQRSIPLEKLLTKKLDWMEKEVKMKVQASLAARPLPTNYW